MRLKMLHRQSSFIEGIGYNKNSKIVFVAFTFEDKIYAYGPLEEKKWIRFRHAKSTGKFFNKEIRDKLSGTEVTGILAEKLRKTL